MPAAEEKRDPGVREFALFLKLIDDGTAHNELSSELNRLLNMLRADAESRGANGESKGKLALELKFAVEAKGVVGVTYNVKLTEPPKRRSGSMLYLTKQNTLTTRNPKQQNFDFGVREVPREEPAQEAPVEVEVVRSL